TWLMVRPSTIEVIQKTVTMIRQSSRPWRSWAEATRAGAVLAARPGAGAASAADAGCDDIARDRRRTGDPPRAAIRMLRLGGVRMIGRFVTRLVDAQAGWAKPFGDFNHRWLSALFRPIRPVKDFLNGVWLGHPVHAAVTDVPIGALTVALILDITGPPVGAD